MENSKSSVMILKASSTQVQRLRNTLVILLTGIGLVFAFYWLAYVETQVWQLLATTGFTGVCALSLVIALIQLKRQRFQTLGYWVLAGTIILHFGSVAVLAEITPFAILTGVPMLVFMAALLLPGKWRVWLSLASGMLLGIVLIDQLQPLVRYPISHLEYVTPLFYSPLVSVAMLLALGAQLIYRRRFSNFRWRLVVAFVSVVLLPIIFIGLVSVINSVEMTRQQVLRQLESFATLKQGEIEDWTSELQHNLNLVVIDDYRYNQILELLATDVSTGTVYDTLYKYLISWTSQQPDFEALVIIDVEGQIVLSTQATGVLQSYLDQGFLERSLARSYITPLFTDEITGENNLVVTLPIMDERGQVQGIVAAKVRLRSLYDIMSRHNMLSAAGVVYLVGQDRALLTPLGDGRQELYIQSEGVRQALVQQNGSSVYYNAAKNQVVLGSYRWVPELEVALLVEEPQMLALASSGSALWLIGGVSLGVLCVAILSAMAVSESIAMPLVLLSQTAPTASKGEFSLLPEFMSDDEIGDVARVFKELSEQIKTLLNEFELGLAERTAVLEKRTTQLKASSYVAREVTTIRDQQELLDRVVRLLSEQFGYYHTGIFLLDDRQKYVVLRASSSAGGHKLIAQGFKLAVGEVGIVGYAAARGEAQVVLDVRDDMHFFGVPELPDARSEVALPLTVHGQVLGVLDIQSEEPGSFEPEDVSILQNLADQLAVAIDNARLLDKANARLQEIDVLLRQQSHEGWERILASRPGWGYVYDGTAVHTQNIAPSDEGLAPQLTIPLQVRGETFGLVNVNLSERSPSVDDVNFANSIVEQAGLALDGARLFQETQHTLEEVAALYRGSQAMASAKSIDDVLQVFVDYLWSSGIDRCVLALKDVNAGAESVFVTIAAAWEPDTERSEVLGNRWNVSQIP
ncbi:MAG: GAF domain-containing protein, partial [Anaerolineae bacterium]|nr:GAF domain-containing protein [Anaerolineae bacterium]